MQTDLVTFEIDVRGETLLLHPQRAVLWPSRSTLLVADPHFGKDDIFRRSGIALPRGPAIDDLQRLGELLAAHSCRRLIVLGDFVHGATQAGDSFLHAFSLWRRAHAAVEMHVIAGNHDRRESAVAWSQQVVWQVRPLLDPPFVFAHHPEDRPDGYVLAGHIHPVVRLPRRGGGGRVPVFWRRAGSMVLPSFGQFTGGAQIVPEETDLLYSAGPERVLALPLTPRRL